MRVARTVEGGRIVGLVGLGHVMGEDAQGVDDRVAVFHLAGDHPDGGDLALALGVHAGAAVGLGLAGALGLQAFSRWRSRSSLARFKLSRMASKRASGDQGSEVRNQIAPQTAKLN